MPSKDVAKQVLIADDDAADVAQITQTLVEAGIRTSVVAVADGADVLKYLRGEDRFSDRAQFPLPTVLLLDLKMSRVSGLRVLEWLNSQTVFKDMLVVAISGLEGPMELQLAYKLGAHSFIRKPCKVEDIKNLTTTFASHWS